MDQLVVQVFHIPDLAVLLQILVCSQMVVHLLVVAYLQVLHLSVACKVVVGPLDLSVLAAHLVDLFELEAALDLLLFQRDVASHHNSDLVVV